MLMLNTATCFYGQGWVELEHEEGQMQTCTIMLVFRAFEGPVLTKCH